MTSFKIKFNFKKYPNLDLDLSSIIKIPLIKNDKVIGVITSYDVDTEELLGYIFDDITFNISTKDYKTVLSMEIFTHIEKNLEATHGTQIKLYRNKRKNS